MNEDPMHLLLPVPSDSVSHPPFSFTVPWQGGVPPAGSQIRGHKVRETRADLRRSGRERHLQSREIYPKLSRTRQH